MSHFLFKYLGNSMKHKRVESMLPYIYFPNRMQYLYRNSFVIIPSSTMPSCHSMTFSTGISGCSNTSSVSHNQEIHSKNKMWQNSTFKVKIKFQGRSWWINILQFKKHSEWICAGTRSWLHRVITPVVTDTPMQILIGLAL